MIGRNVWIICAGLVCAAANAQVEPSFRRLDIADGMPSSQVMDVMQDRKGYIWVATADGLARFDGIGFRVYRHNPSDAESIPCNDVQTVFEDSHERLWLGCADRGLALMRDRDAGRFVPFQAELERLGYDTLDVYSFAESAGGHLWLGTFRRGVLRLDADGHLQTLQDWVNVPEPLRNSDVLELHVDRSGDLWLATTAGLWRVRNIDSAAQARAEQVIAEGMALAIFDAADGQLWIGGATSMHRIAVGAPADEIVEVEGLEGATVFDGIAQDRTGAMWLGTRSGLIRLSAGRAPQTISARAAVPGGLPATSIQDLLVDNEGGLWIATRQGGLGYLRPDRDNFELIRHDPLDERSLPPSRLIGIEACPDGRVYVATGFGGLAQINDVGEVRRIGKAPRTMAEGRGTHSLMCDPEGMLWLGRPGAVTRFDPNSGEERSWGAAEGIIPGYVELLVAGRGGDVWISSAGSGISRINANGLVSSWQTAEQGIAIADFEQIGVDSDGRVWLADAAGIRLLDPSAAVFRPTQGGPDQRVTAFSLDADGSLWTASVAGLEQWQVDGFALRRTRLIGAENGLPTVDFYAVLIDPVGEIWLSSSRGLWRVQREPTRVELMDSRRGLPSLQYISRPIMRMIGGKVVTTTLEGVLRFDPLRLFSVATAPPLRLASASIRRGDFRVDLDPLAEQWQLRWDDRDLRVEARALSFADPGANHYGFLLEEHDAGWVDTAARPEREFTRIQSGTYRLRIRASNVAGVSAVNEMLRTLHVASPPWLSWQAWLAYVVGLVSLFWIVFSEWRQRIERRHGMALAEERRLAAESANTAKSDFLADVGHEIRTPMAGVLGMTDLLERSKLDQDQYRWTISIKRSGEHMLRLINDLLDLSRIEAGKLELNLQATDIIALIEDVRSLETPLAQARGIKLVTDLEADFPKWIRCDGRRVKQILLNLVNNALKFTEHGEVCMQVSRIEPGMMLIEVSDSGAGMSAEQLAMLFARFRQTESGKLKGGSGLGLAITAQLVRVLGGSIEVRSVPAEGSRFSVRLPLEASIVPDEVAINTSNAHADSDRPLAGIGVLVVEDDAVIREVNARLLEALGARVEVAPHALDALSRFQPGRDRIALLDLDLPGIDGLQLIALLRSSAPTGLLAVAVTARSGADTEQRCRDAGFDAFMRKPVSAEHLRAQAQRWRARLDGAS